MLKRDIQTFLVFLTFAAIIFATRGMSERTMIAIGCMGFFFLIEYAFPSFPKQPVDKLRRWKVNLSLTLAINVTASFMPFMAAVMVYYEGWGLFHIAGDLPLPLYLIASVLALDLGFYLQHIAHHNVPILWRLHRVHHTDLAYDVSLAGRLHPLEGITVGIVRTSVILLFGIEPLGFVAYLLTLVVTSQFIHSNVYLPMWLDKLLRLVIVTPRMHYVHHSTTVSETNSNYSLSFSFWDRIFGTYKEAPKKGYEAMEVGLKEFRDEEALSLKHLIMLPFKDRYGR